LSTSQQPQQQTNMWGKGPIPPEKVCFFKKSKFSLNGKLINKITKKKSFHQEEDLVLFQMMDTVCHI